LSDVCISYELRTLPNDLIILSSYRNLRKITSDFWTTHASLHFPGDAFPFSDLRNMLNYQDKFIFPVVAPPLHYNLTIQEKLDTRVLFIS